MPAAVKVLFSQTFTIGSYCRATELSLGGNIMCLRFCISTRLAPATCCKEWPHIFKEVEVYTYILMSQGKIASSCMCLQFAAELEPVMFLLI